MSMVRVDLGRADRRAVSYFAAGSVLWYLVTSILSISYLVGIADANLERE
ncbi:hypothetical protein [Nonomuraea sp. NEAU-A123]|nr:hypothetical protein [Nonomuraea sp. NEAU-A123]MBT2226271.1 hypothetical protein [Nonomuraea sp. NEAU-A123]